MACIIVRKDNTSIACLSRSKLFSKKKLKVLELSVAVTLIVVGTSVLLIIQ